MDFDIAWRLNIFDPFLVEISKNDTQFRYSKGFKLTNEENRFSLVLIPYELTPCKDGRFNMGTLWAGRILTPKRRITAKRYWIELRLPTATASPI